MAPIACFPASVTLAGLLCLAGNGTVENRADAPVIANLKLEPSTAPRGSSVRVTVEIFDRQGRDDIVPILYFLREGWELIKVPLHDDGTRGDRIAGDGFYSGKIVVPPSATIGDHWFIVYLNDRSGLRSNLLIYEFWVSSNRESI